MISVGSSHVKYTLTCNKYQMALPKRIFFNLQQVYGREYSHTCTHRVSHTLGSGHDTQELGQMCSTSTERTSQSLERFVPHTTQGDL